MSTSHIDSTSDCVLVKGSASPVLKVKRRRLRSTVWNDFKIIRCESGKDIAICSHCSQAFTAGSGTSNMKSNLKRCKRKPSDGVSPKNEEVSPSFKSKFNQERSRRDLCKMIIKHQYPFRMVDHAYFRVFINNLQPLFDLKHRVNTSCDCVEFNKEEKQELYNDLGKLQSRISLTTDLWTASNTKESYMCLTCHYIDDDWVLNAKVLNFRFMESNHIGEELAKCIMRCLIVWNIDSKISTITLDNATNNDSMVTKVKGVLNRDRRLLLDGAFFQIRCASHVLNIIVKDGIDILEFILFNIRESCKYVKSTPQRKLKWKVACSQVDIKTEKKIHGDCITWWNSTYEMLAVAIEYEEAFDRLEKREHDFNTNPSREEWAFARLVCNCLRVFYESTKTLLVSDQSKSEASKCPVDDDDDDDDDDEDYDDEDNDDETNNEDYDDGDDDKGVAAQSL